MATTVVFAMSTVGPSGRRVFTHTKPVWRSQSNFIIVANLDDGQEQLWARQISATRFSICCIPFFVYNLALGDIVETDDNYCYTKLIECSGRYVFRAWIHSEHKSFLSTLVNRLEDFGALVELSSNRLVAIDTETEQMAKDVSGWLSQLELRGHIQYETGML